jgi:hypothetical protein
MKLGHLMLAATLPLSTLFACGGKEEDPPPPPSSAEGKEDTCAEFCTALSTCEGFDDTDCESNCADAQSTSRGGQEVLTSCFDADVCDASELEGLAALACVTDGLGDLELSSAAEKYCNDSVDAINACLGMEPAENPFGSCEDTIALASDELLEGLNDCAEEDCENVETCVFLQAVLALPVDVLSGLEEGDELSPALLSQILAIGVVFGQLGLGEGDVGGILGDPMGMGGGAN